MKKAVLIFTFVAVMVAVMFSYVPSKQAHSTVNQASYSLPTKVAFEPRRPVTPVVPIGIKLIRDAELNEFASKLVAEAIHPTDAELQNTTVVIAFSTKGNTMSIVVSVKPILGRSAVQGIRTPTGSNITINAAKPTREQLAAAIAESVKGIGPIS